MKKYIKHFLFALCILLGSAGLWFVIRASAQLTSYVQPTALTSNTLSFFPGLGTNYQATVFSLPTKTITWWTAGQYTTNTEIVQYWISLDGTNRFYLPYTATNWLASNGYFTLSVQPTNIPVYSGIAVLYTNNANNGDSFQAY